MNTNRIEKDKEESNNMLLGVGIFFLAVIGFVTIFTLLFKKRSSVGLTLTAEEIGSLLS